MSALLKDLERPGRGLRAAPRRGRRSGSIMLLHRALLALLLLPMAPSAAGTPGVDPEAARLLKRMTDFVGGQDRFSLETVNAVEVVLDSGQKLQFTGGVRTTVQRPDKLHSERVGDVMRQSLYYDGGPLAPLSVAGVARRTTRRTITVVAALPSGCTPTTAGGVRFYGCGVDYYRTAFQGTNLVYVTAQP